jgi:tetratricopeptide (TPR) repeat protein
VENSLPELPARIPGEHAGDGPVFSRVVRALPGQLVEIPFRGTGWVYLGELGNRRGIVYDSRRLETGSGAGVPPEGQSFIFLAEAPGTYALKFYKQDFIRDYVINDYVQVIVGEGSAGSSRVIAAPRWPPPEGEAAEGGRGSPGSPPPASSADEGIVPVTPPRAAAGTAPELPPGAGPPSAPPLSLNTPEEYLRQARETLNAGRIEDALAVLDAFREAFPPGTDEAWWLYGQLLEANSPSRDIRLALEYYRRLVREYPQSPRAGEALRRIAYLERYYFTIQ